MGITMCGMSQCEQVGYIKVLNNEDHTNGWAFTLPAGVDHNDHFMIIDGNNLVINPSNLLNNVFAYITVECTNGSINIVNRYACACSIYGHTLHKFMISSMLVLNENVLPSWGNNFNISIIYHNNGPSFSESFETLICGKDVDNCLNIQQLQQTPCPFVLNGNGTVSILSEEVTSSSNSTYNISIVPGTSSGAKVVINSNVIADDIPMFTDTGANKFYVLLLGTSCVRDCNTNYNVKVNNIIIDINNTNYLNFSY